MRKSIVHVGAILFLNPPECRGTMRPDNHACSLEIAGGMPCSSMLRQHRNVGSSLSPNNYANTATLEWSVSEVLNRCSMFGARQNIRKACLSFIFRTWIISTGSCMPTRSRARSARLAFSVLKFWSLCSS